MKSWSGVGTRSAKLSFDEDGAVLDLLGQKRPLSAVEEDDEEEDEAWVDERRTKESAQEEGTPSGPLDILV